MAATTWGKRGACCKHPVGRDQVCYESYSAQDSPPKPSIWPKVPCSLGDALGVGDAGWRAKMHKEGGLEAVGLVVYACL